MKKTDFKQMAQAYGTIIALLVIIMIFGVLKPAAFLTLKNFINYKPADGGPYHYLHWSHHGNGGE